MTTHKVRCPECGNVSDSTIVEGTTTIDKKCSFCGAKFTAVYTTVTTVKTVKQRTPEEIDAELQRVKKKSNARKRALRQLNRSVVCLRREMDGLITDKDISDEGYDAISQGYKELKGKYKATLDRLSEMIQKYEFTNTPTVAVDNGNGIPQHIEDQFKKTGVCSDCN